MERSVAVFFLRTSCSVFFIFHALADFQLVKMKLLVILATFLRTVAHSVQCRKPQTPKVASPKLLYDMPVLRDRL